MSGFVNLDTEILNQSIGSEIEYYELWDPLIGEFRRGKSFIHGIYKDDSGATKIYADLIWGNDLDSIVEDDGGFCFENGSYIYLAPEPFQLYKITWLNNLALQEQKVIPADTLLDVDFTARLFTSNEYNAVRINLDGTNYNPLTQ
ncbi:hypothetical protein [Dyadobacter sp. CY356]|uniref:hypothetical protein n=1 Tax=Dyadobacter sp. CY356 TaxID=2906442 RepID=UPI001F42079A|nr:hypothetical protein [Dyadobacter sp. CY356]MCF0057144.1 hypothetical protein [Dyadobacter sp. CY356]